MAQALLDIARSQALLAQILTRMDEREATAA